MKSTNKTVAYGVYLFLSFVAFFFVMKLVGLEKVSELRLLNIVFAVFFTNRLAKTNINSDSPRASYLGNLSSLMLANLIAVFASALSLMIYVTAIDPDMMDSIGNGFFLGNDLTIYQVVFAIILEGSATAAIVSFTLMQYWKNSVAKSKAFERKV